MTALPSSFLQDSIPVTCASGVARGLHGEPENELTDMQTFVY